MSDLLQSRNRSDAVRVGRQREITWFTAIIGVFLVGLNFSLLLGVTTATVAGFGLLPVWYASVRRYRSFKAIILLAAASLVIGGMLALTAAPDRVVDVRVGLETTILFATAFAGIGLFLWARTEVPIDRLALSYGLGALISGVLNSPGSDNAWKFQISLPITIVALSLVWRSKPIVSVLMLLGIAAASIVADSRSYFAFCLLAAVLVMWQARPTGGTRRMGKGSVVLLLVAVSVVLYLLGNALLVGGYLGEDLQQRSIEQVNRGGSLIAGGRPEWTATVGLMADHPVGYGVGVVPIPADIWVAKEGLASVGIATNNGYVDNFMFGGQFKLHSIIADFWAAFGPLGVVFGLYLGLVLIRSLVGELSRRTASALVILLVITAVWDLAFGPIRSNLPDVAFALALVLPLIPRNSDSSQKDLATLTAAGGASRG